MTYVIQSAQNNNLCIGVTNAAAGSAVSLTNLGGPYSQWVMDPNTGLITLAANPNLCLDVQGYNQKQGQVIIAQQIPGRNSQKWNWVGSPPTISNVQYPTMVLDNSGGNAIAGNPVLIWPINGGQNQSWSTLSISSAMKELEAA